MPSERNKVNISGHTINDYEFRIGIRNRLLAMKQEEDKEKKSLFRLQKKLLFVASFLLSVLCSPPHACFAAEPAPASGAQQIEATIIHVDQYAVYAPNLVFYYDTQDKRKVASLMKAAEQLRNKKANITYSSSADKRLTLIDLTAAAGTGNTATDKPLRESPRTTPELRKITDPAFEQATGEENPPTEPQKPVRQAARERAPAQAPDQVAGEVSPPAEPQKPARQSAREKTPAQAVEQQSAPITRNELTAFVRRILELNGKKDITAVIPFYADRVDYYDRGVVDREYVRRDLGYYFRNWDQISTTLDGDVVMIVLDQPEVRIAKFISVYSVKNDKKALAGKTENIWKIQRMNGALRLIDVKQRIVSKD